MQLNVAVQFVQQLQQLIIRQEMTVGVWRSFYFLSFYFFIYFMHVSITTSPYGNVQLSMRPPAWGPRPQWEAWPHGLLCPRTKPTAPQSGFRSMGASPPNGAYGAKSGSSPPTETEESRKREKEEEEEEGQ